MPKFVQISLKEGEYMPMVKKREFYKKERKVLVESIEKGWNDIRTNLGKTEEFLTYHEKKQINNLLFRMTEISTKIK